MAPFSPTWKTAGMGSASTKISESDDTEVSTSEMSITDLDFMEWDAAKMKVMKTNSFTFHKWDTATRKTVEWNATKNDAMKTDVENADVTNADVANADVANADVAKTNASDVDAVKIDAEVSAAQEHGEEVSDNVSHADSSVSDDIPSSSPYAVGQTIQLQIDEEHAANAKIVKLFEPFTLSCAMVIHLDTPDLKGEFVLKLYDRRFSPQLRTEEETVPWTPELESEYREFVNSGCITGFFDFCAAGYREDWWWGDSYSKRTKWSKAQLEGYLQFLCRRTYGIEKEVYETIRDLQGKHVPRLFAHPWLQLSEKPNKYLDCPGILLEYIQGYELTDIKENAPENDWQYICDEAVQIVQLICVRGVLNKDIKTRSFVIRQDSDLKKPKLCMMDFGLCMFRREQKSVAEFREMQAHQNEEGAVGFVMQRQLKGGFKYLESSWSCDLGEDFMME